MSKLHGLSRAQRLAYLGNAIEYTQAAERAQLMRRGRSHHTATTGFDPHTAVEISNLIERVLFPEGVK